MAGKELLLRVAKLSFVEGMKNNEIGEVLRKDNIIEATSNFSGVQGWIEEAGRWLLERNDRLTDMEKHNAPERKIKPRPLPASSAFWKHGLFQVAITIPQATTRRC